MAKVTGAKELRAALRRAPAELRREATTEVRKSTKSMHTKAMRGFDTASSYAPFHHGKSGMQNIKGLARRLYRWSVSEKTMTGKVGLISKTSLRRAFYLRMFLTGTIHQPARNVHEDAFEEERDVYVENQKGALERVVRRL